jgi:hypothetical protein
VRLTRPGHFLLGQELAGVPGAAGIEIAAGDVVLDLGGHALVGSGGSGDGIVVTGGCTGVVIRNGTVSGWGGWGIDASGARGVHIERIVARGNHSGGIAVGSGGFVAATRCEGNDGTGLLAAGCQAWLEDNTLTGNAVGLDVLGTDNVIVRNRARANGRDFRIGGGNATLPPVDLVSSR